MVRWILAGLAVAGLALAWTTAHAGVVALGLLLTFACVFGFVLSLAAERIADRSRPDSAMLSHEELLAFTRRRDAAESEARHGDSPH
jgi:hypothetical protein